MVGRAGCGRDVYRDLYVSGVLLPSAVDERVIISAGIGVGLVEVVVAEFAGGFGAVLLKGLGAGLCEGLLTGLGTGLGTGFERDFLL